MDIGLIQFLQTGKNGIVFIRSTTASLLVVLLIGCYQIFSQAKTAVSDTDVMGFGVRKYVKLTQKLKP